MLRTRCFTGGRLTGNVRFRAGGSRRFFGRFGLVGFSWTRLGRYSAAGLTGNARFRAWGRRRFFGHLNLSAFSCTRFSRNAGLFHRAGLLLDCCLRLGRVGAGF